jgi:transposase InsO family protein
MELHSDQGRKVESRLIQEILERIGVLRTRTKPLHPHLDGVMERYVKTIEKHLRMVSSIHQRDWDERLPIFLLTYRASTQKTTGVTLANMVFGRELCIPCDLMFGDFPEKEQSTTNYASNVVERLHDIHHFRLSAPKRGQ